MTDQYEVLDALRAIVSKNSPFTTWTVSTPHLVMLWEKAQELERQACAKFCDGEGLHITAAAIRARGQV